MTSGNYEEYYIHLFGLVIQKAAQLLHVQSYHYYSFSISQISNELLKLWTSADIYFANRLHGDNLF